MSSLWLDIYRSGLEADLPVPALNLLLPEIYFATDTKNLYFRDNNREWVLAGVEIVTFTDEAEYNAATPGALQLMVLTSA